MAPETSERPVSRCGEENLKRPENMVAGGGDIHQQIDFQRPRPDDILIVIKGAQPGHWQAGSRHRLFAYVRLPVCGFPMRRQIRGGG